MPLRLTYRGGAEAPLEVEGLTPNQLRECSLAEIQQLPIQHGSQQAALAEFFRVQGSASEETIWCEGDLSDVHWLGAGMRSGRMLIAGNAGRHVGSGMRGGAIHVHGHAGDWLGGEMRRGLIKVEGSAGDCVGAAYRGSPVGMRGGTILISGSAGNEIGHSMRRGMIAVAGDIADLAGSHMRAGTIFAFGKCGTRHGAGMIRGTLGFFGGRPQLLPSFRRAGRCRPLALRLLLRDLAQRGMGIARSVSEDIELYHGDLLEGGRGEIWCG